jgi:lysozyme family protein
MDANTKLEEAINSIKNGFNSVGDKYDSHIREKAIERVNEKIEEKGLNINQIKQEDYEAMVSDLSKDIKEDYATKASQGLLAFVGLDMLLGW